MIWHNLWRIGGNIFSPENPEVVIIPTERYTPMTTINTQEDLLKALRENPEWREAVRVLILGEDHLHLPQALRELTETVNRFVASQERFNDEMRQLRQDQSQFNQNALSRFDRMESDSSRLKESYTLSEMAEAAELISQDMGWRYERNMTRGELGRIALDIAAGEPLSDELKSFRRADLVIVAHDGEETKYLAVEVSYTAAQRDTRRAIRNARILTEQTGCTSLPVIASARNTREVQEEVDSGRVYWHQIPD